MVAETEQGGKGRIRVVRHDGHLTRRDRNLLNGHASGLLWFTGLSGAGKSTIAHGVEKNLYERGIRSFVLDGDNIRCGVNSDLGFSREDRRENIRRIAEIAALFMEAGVIVLASFITPYRADREYLRQRFKGDHFYEIYVKCALEECERRDPKGKYRLARQGLIPEYTGISSPFEEPDHPDLVIDTEKTSAAAAVEIVLSFMALQGLLKVHLPSTEASQKKARKFP